MLACIQLRGRLLTWKFAHRETHLVLACHASSSCPNPNVTHAIEIETHRPNRPHIHIQTLGVRTSQILHATSLAIHLDLLGTSLKHTILRILNGLPFVWFYLEIILWGITSNVTLVANALIQTLSRWFWVHILHLLEKGARGVRSLLCFPSERISLLKSWLVLKEAPNRHWVPIQLSTERHLVIARGFLAENTLIHGVLTKHSKCALNGSCLLKALI